MKTKNQRPPRSVPRDRSPHGTIRTFLAEDMPLLMTLLARIVSKDKRVCIVGSAPDGRRAIGNAPTLRPDLVITDLHMPGLDGAEFTRQLKQLPHPPIVFMVTSDDGPEARARSLAAGADAFLPKAANLVSQLRLALQEFFPAGPEPGDPESNHFHESLITI